MCDKRTDRVETIRQRKQFRSWVTKGTWYYGGTDTMKSLRAFQNYNPNTHYIKPPQDQWWDEYTGQETVIIDDFRGKLSFSCLLQLTDGVPMFVQIRRKEGVPMIAKEIIITSLVTPEETYSKLGKCENSMAQLYRRFKVLSPTEKVERTWEDALAHIRA
jgi:hypothetical protein